MFEIQTSHPKRPRDPNATLLIRVHRGAAYACLAIGGVFVVQGLLFFNMSGFFLAQYALPIAALGVGMVGVGIWGISQPRVGLKLSPTALIVGEHPVPWEHIQSVNFHSFRVPTRPGLSGVIQLARGNGKQRKALYLGLHPQYRDTHPRHRLVSTADVETHYVFRDNELACDLQWLAAEILRRAPQATSDEGDRDRDGDNVSIRDPAHDAAITQGAAIVKGGLAPNSTASPGPSTAATGNCDTIAMVCHCGEEFVVPLTDAETTQFCPACYEAFHSDS